MSKERYGFGVIGVGAIGKFHAKAISATEHAELIGFFNRTRSKAEKLSKEFSCVVFDSIEEMLQDPRIDIVNVCTASGAHLEPALKVMKAGKHCLIEKPMEISTERCDKLIEAAHQNKVKLGVIFQSRFSEAARQLKKALDEDRFGNLVMGDAYVKWHRSPEYYASGAWRGTWKLDGGGALMNQGIHSVDLLQWYLGPVHSVKAFMANRKHQGIEVEDTVVAAVRFENGALGTIECSTAIYPGSLKKIEVKGAEGSAILEEDRLIEWAFKEEKEADEKIKNQMNKDNASGGGASDPMSIKFKGHQLQIEDFIEAIEKDRKPFIDGEEGRKSVAIVEAIYESARTGKEIFVKSARLCRPCLRNM